MKTPCACPQCPAAEPGGPDPWTCPGCGQVWLMWSDSSVNGDGETIFKDWYAKEER